MLKNKSWQIIDNVKTNHGFIFVITKVSIHFGDSLTDAFVIVVKIDFITFIMLYIEYPMIVRHFIALPRFVFVCSPHSFHFCPSHINFSLTVCKYYHSLHTVQYTIYPCSAGWYLFGEEYRTYIWCTYFIIPRSGNRISFLSQTPVVPRIWFILILTRRCCSER